MSVPFASTQLYWYLTRSTGAVSLVLFTAAVVLGVLDVQRVSSPRWPRFVIDGLHRKISLLALVFLALHVITTILDSFVSISLIEAFVPFIGSYRPFWLGLGAVALDLALAVTITSLLRARVGYRAWRIVHWLAYACWPIALMHSFGTGSDADTLWMLVLSGFCVAAVAAAVMWRVARGWPSHIRARSAALGATTLFVLFLTVWLPSGPLGPEWPRRAGTPSNLLAHSDTGTATR
ncbi:MAG TPA: ferric reductase-like transmembrane domain-containing protein [Solirubrobacteraceae bacterium]|nr:ferric reductase-like transmembrane domain-containing protein [Solirubrobacteraceae bacterium]